MDFRDDLRASDVQQIGDRWSSASSIHPEIIRLFASTRQSGDGKQKSRQRVGVDERPLNRPGFATLGIRCGKQTIIPASTIPVWSLTASEPSTFRYTPDEAVILPLHQPKAIAADPLQSLSVQYDNSTTSRSNELLSLQ